jgi:hypothetical protein
VLGRAASHAAEFAAMGTPELTAGHPAEFAAGHSTEFTAMGAASHAAEFAAMGTPVFTAGGAADMAANFAFTAAHDTAFDATNHVENLKHLNHLCVSVKQTPGERSPAPEDTHPCGQPDHLDIAFAHRLPA